MAEASRWARACEADAARRSRSISGSFWCSTIGSSVRGLMLSPDNQQRSVMSDAACGTPGTCPGAVRRMPSGNRWQGSHRRRGRDPDDPAGEHGLQATARRMGDEATRRLTVVLYSRRPRCCAPRRAPETVRSTWPNPAGRQRATAGRGAPRWRSVRGRRRRSGRAHTSSTSAPRTADAAEAHATTPHRRCLWPDLRRPPSGLHGKRPVRTAGAGASCWCRTSPARAWPAAVRCRSSPRHDRALTAAALARTLTHDRTEDVPSDADRLLSAGRGGPAGVCGVTMIPTNRPGAGTHFGEGRAEWCGGAASECLGDQRSARALVEWAETMAATVRPTHPKWAPSGKGYTGAVLAAVTITPGPGIVVVKLCPADQRAEHAAHTRARRASELRATSPGSTSPSSSTRRTRWATDDCSHSRAPPVTTCATSSRWRS